MVPTQDVPRSIMDRLLALAPEVANDGELTPIQAWSEVQRKPLFGDLGVQNLMGLAEKLRDAAKCHGYVKISPCQGLNRADEIAVQVWGGCRSSSLPELSARFPNYQDNILIRPENPLRDGRDFPRKKPSGR